MTPEERREYDREYYKRNREKIVEYKSKWRQANPEKQREYERKWRQANPEYNRKYREVNPGKERERKRKYEEANLQKVRDIKRESARKMRQLYPEKHSARSALNSAIASGKITRPGACEHCFYPCKPHGHHTDYTKPLLVMWLCSQCHGAQHRRENQNA